MDTQKGRKHSKLIGATFLKQKYILHEQIHFMIKKKLPFVTQLHT